MAVENVDQKENFTGFNGPPQKMRVEEESAFSSDGMEHQSVAYSELLTPKDSNYVSPAV